jgi:CheY-like chemotaxis protein
MEPIYSSVGRSKQTHHHYLQLMSDFSRLILVVDDDIDYSDYLTFILNQEGYSVKVAQNGLLALEILRSIEPHPDLLILDLYMPMMSGIEFRFEQNEDFRISEIPVLFLSEFKILPSERSLLKSSHCTEIINEINNILK